jgi:hypothetical protein
MLVRYASRLFVEPFRRRGPFQLHYEGGNNVVRIRLRISNDFQALARFGLHLRCVGVHPISVEYGISEAVVTDRAESQLLMGVMLMMMSKTFRNKTRKEELIYTSHYRTRFLVSKKIE